MGICHDGYLDQIYYKHTIRVIRSGLELYYPVLVNNVAIKECYKDYSNDTYLLNYADYTDDNDMLQ